MNTKVPQTLQGKQPSLSQDISRSQGNSPTPPFTVNDFDDEDEDDEHKLDPISDDEDFSNNQQSGWNEEEWERRHSNTNLTHLGNDNDSEINLSFTDSDEDDDFGKISKKFSYLKTDNFC